MMDKNLVWQPLIEQLATRIEVAQKAAQQAHDTATNEESVAENKYDTLGLEAAYLAQGQQAHVAQCQEDLAAYKALRIIDVPSTQVALASLVHLTDDKDRDHYFFVGQHAGGIKLHIKSTNATIQVLVITTKAPLGKALLGGVVDDEIVLKVGPNSVVYYINSID